jgi:hypothetical protein
MNRLTLALLICTASTPAMAQDPMLRFLLPDNPRLAECLADPCPLISPADKALLDSVGRTLYGAPPPRATLFVRALIEEVKLGLKLPATRGQP